MYVNVVKDYDISLENICWTFIKYFKYLFSSLHMEKSLQVGNVHGFFVYVDEQ